MLDNCQARQESDQMRCVRCGYVWDRSDPEPPECLPVVKSPPLSPAPEKVGFVSGLPDDFRN